MNHIKDTHGNTICHRFLRNECQQKRCFFSHNIHTENSHSVQDAQFVERHAETQVPTAQNFRHPSPPRASGRQGEQGPDQPNATHAMLQPAANRCVNNTSDVPNNAFNNEPGCNNLEQK